MKSVKLSKYFEVIKPEYVYLRLKPNNSIRNNNTHKIARAVASIYKNLIENIRKEEVKVINALGREFLFGTKYSYTVPQKVSYYVYIEKNRVEFYFIVPKSQLSFLKEKISDTWSNITIEQVENIPLFKESATKYQLVYDKEDAMSLAVDRKDNDLIRSNLNVIDVLEDGDKVGVFYNFVPISQFSWAAKYRNTIDKVKANKPIDREKVNVTYGLKMLITVIVDIVDTIGEVLGGENKKGKSETATAIETALDRLTGKGSYGDSTKKKGGDKVLDTQILVMSESEDKLRQNNNARSLAQSFDVITEDNRLVFKRHKKEFNPLDYRLQGVETNKTSSLECSNFIALPGRELLESYDGIGKVETQETQVPEDLRKGDIRIGINTYRGKKQDAYLSTDGEYKMLTTMLIGPTRAGKSTLIGNMAHDALKVGESVVLIDYIGKCELSSEVSALFPKEKVLNIECHDFDNLQGLGYNEIPFSDNTNEGYQNAKIQTTQLKTLVNSINSDDTPLSARMNRYLTSAALTVFLNGGSIKDVFSVLQNAKKRKDYLLQIPEEQYENMEEYIEYLLELDNLDSEGNIKGTKLHLVEGIISRLNILKDNAFLEMMLKKDCANNIDLVEEIQKNQLICIKMPESMFSTDNERDIYTTYWITKLWLALQIRKDKYESRKNLTKVNLVIDELYQVVNTEIFLTSKLNRLAKFNLKPIISCHHLKQLRHMQPELRSANASYLLISGCDKENFKELSEELYPFTSEDLLNLKRYHSMNLIKNKDGYGRFITKLPPPVGSRAKEEIAVSREPDITKDIIVNGEVV